MGLLEKIFDFFKPPTRAGETRYISELEKEKFNKRYDDLGEFSYQDDGFTFQLNEEQILIKWAEIKKITAYKADLMTVDEIRMDIFYADWQFTISEETPGFYQFVIKIKSVFESIPKEWDLNIMFPAFETNYTVLFER